LLPRASGPPLAARSAAGSGSICLVKQIAAAALIAGRTGSVTVIAPAKHMLMPG
jgi:hypothetical protein